MMNVDQTVLGSATVLRLEGDIDEDGINVLRMVLLNCLRQRRVNVVVDLSDVKFVSYMGVGVLVERLRQLRKYGGDLKLVGVNVATQRLFRMVGVTSVFETFETETLAVQGFRQAA